MLHRFQILAKKLLLPRRIAYAIRHIARPVIVEVGANDGKTGDPLFNLIRRKSDGVALLIEPLPHLFERLQTAYQACDHCRFENVAVAANVGRLPIYFISPEARAVVPTLPSFFEELASFDREKVARVLGAENEQFLCERMVDTAPLHTLLLRHRLDHVDLLQIDTEGFDYEVLKTFPFSTIKPSLVCFEHSHLAEHDRQASRQFMMGHGYKVERWGKDFVCVQRSK